MRHIKFLCVFLALATPAKAQEPLIPVNYSGTYDFSFSGIPFGKVDVDLQQTATGYKVRSSVTTVGVAKMFVTHKSESESTGTGSGFVYDHVNYETNYSTNKKPKRAKWERKGGQMLSFLVEPPQDLDKRPAVPDEYKVSSYDPTALGMMIRSGVITARAQGKSAFSVNLFDGKRLWEITIRLGEVTTVPLHGIPTEVYRVSARRKPLEGFTDKELSRQSGTEPAVAIYFSEDAKFLPVLLELPMMLGVASATLRMQDTPPASTDTPSI